MRFVLCDDDNLFTSMIELMLTDHGHTVVGVADRTPDAVALVASARPDVVIVDLSLGFNTDFDIIETAISVGSTIIVFSHNADEVILSKYPARPTFVAKPDLSDLERVVARLGVDNEARVMAHDRRERPAREAHGRVPTGVGDAQAFYEALNDASAGDVLVIVEIPDLDDTARDATEAATSIRAMLRTTDRLLASVSAVRVYLPAGDDGGAASFRSRIQEVDALPAGSTVRSVVLGPDEQPADAFDRLKSAAPDPAD